MANADVDVIDVHRRLIDSLLAKAEQVKPGKEIEPPLTETQLGESFWLIQDEDALPVKQLSQQTRFAAVEIAFREKFYGLLVCFPFSGPIFRRNPQLTALSYQASTTIEDSEFVCIWNLLDIISVFSDNGSFSPRKVLKDILTPFRTMRTRPHILVD